MSKKAKFLQFRNFLKRIDIFSVIRRIKFDRGGNGDFEVHLESTQFILN